MKTFEESRFPERIVSTGGLSDMVRCTDVIPDASSMPVGTIYHLTSPQAGYQVNHIYICVVISGINTWKDITENHEISPDMSGCTASGYLVEFDGVMIRLSAIWNTPEDEENDVWLRDVLMRKLGTPPANLTDGEIVTISSTRDQYGDEAYWSGSITSSPAGYTYMYRLFHVFSSGKLTYTEMPVVE